MNRNILPAAFALAFAAGAAAIGSPLKVKTAGAGSQVVIMCPDCKAKIACAQVGDHRIGLTVDVENPKLGQGSVIVHVQDKDKKPITDAKVTVALTMPKHGHGLKPLTAKHVSHGEYLAATNQLGMSGEWKAEVSVALVGGDTVKQAFAFTK